MPKKDIDYSKTVIYKIVCNDLSITDCYVGRTTDFTKRKSQHKYSCNTEKDPTYSYRVYQMIRDNGGWDNWTMIEVEKYSCNDGNEAKARERYWYEELSSLLNMAIPNRSSKEYWDDNKDRMAKLKLDYYIQNKDTIKINGRRFYDKNKEDKKISNKKYQDDNKERLQANKKEYYQKNKEAIRAKNKIRYEQKKEQSS